MTKLLVIGGSNWTDLKSVEVVNLDESNPNLQCQSPPNYPYATRGSSGQLFRGTPLICGGANYYSPDIANCFSLLKGQWSASPNVSRSRAYAISEVMSVPNGDGKLEDILLVAGATYFLS